MTPMQLTAIRVECAEDLISVNESDSLSGKRQADGDTPSLPSAPNYDLMDLDGGAFEYGTLCCVVKIFTTTTTIFLCVQPGAHEEMERLTIMHQYRLKKPHFF